MNQKLFDATKRLYEDSVGKCTDGDAWEWELKFAEAIIRECAGLHFRGIEEISAETEYKVYDTILNHFGLK